MIVAALDRLPPRDGTGAGRCSYVEMDRQQRVETHLWLNRVKYRIFGPDTFLRKT
mgnify:CR=1 FL=1